jgi:plasmid stabilization system protein ParE
MEDRETIFLQIATDNSTAAIELDQLLARKANLLIDHPAAGRTGRVTGTRELVAHRHYVLVYDFPLPDRVRILNVVHTSQQWPPLSAPTRPSAKKKARKSRARRRPPP